MEFKVEVDRNEERNVLTTEICFIPQLRKKYSRSAKKWVMERSIKDEEVRRELLNMLPVPKGMNFITWNARGVARPSFRKNLKHIIKQHKPCMVVITEIRTSLYITNNTMKRLPLDRWEIAEPWGFSGGIVVLRDSIKVDFKPIGRDLHAIHGVVQVISTNTFVFLSGIYASTKLKRRLISWKELEDMAPNINMPWLVLGD